jgi:polysaccharide biosynthesis protein PslH
MHLPGYGCRASVVPMCERMRILWLSPYLPAPTFGAGTRVFNLLKVLSRTCEIDLIAGSVAGEPDQEMLADVRSLCNDVHVVGATITSQRHKRLLQLKSLLGRHPMHYRIFYSKEMQEAINHAARQNAYDVVVLESSFMGYYCLPAGLPRVLDQHNVESEILLRSGQRERSMLRRSYNLLEYWKYRSDERRICRQMDLILATSTRDCESTLDWSGVPACVVIPNGVDTMYFVPSEHDDQQTHTVLFTGTMNYSPNAEAMLYFVGEIWPLIQERIPDAVLQIVGHSPPLEITKLAQVSNVDVLGSVPDVRSYLVSAQVVVAPLRIGGGTRLKILEAMAMARAVVSTSLGCEGLDVQHGRHLLVADDPAAFAECVCDLLTNPTRRAEIGQEGCQLVHESYDWRTLGLRMEEALRDVLRARHSEAAKPDVTSQVGGEPAPPS